MSDELNLSHSHHYILFYCVLTVQYSSEQIDVRDRSSMSCDILSVCNLIVSNNVMYFIFTKLLIYILR